MPHLFVGRAEMRRLASSLGGLAVVAFFVWRLAQPAPPGLAPPLAEPLRSVPVAAKELALTFDISWGTAMPPKVLAILERDRVAATFFLSGPWARRHADLVRAMVRAGFQVESHGEAHVNYSSLSDQALRANLEAAASTLRSITGQPIDMVRPPNGDYNARTLALTRSLGFTTVLWDTDSLDWMNPGVDRIVRRVLTRAHPGDIVLLHASDTCKETDRALPVIVAGLRREGYRLVTIDQLLADAQAP